MSLFILPRFFLNSSWSKSSKFFQFKFWRFFRSREKAIWGPGQRSCRWSSIRPTVIKSITLWPKDSGLGVTIPGTPKRSPSPKKCSKTCRCRLGDLSGISSRTRLKRSSKRTTRRRVATPRALFPKKWPLREVRTSSTESWGTGAPGASRPSKSRIWGERGKENSGFMSHVGWWIMTSICPTTATGSVRDPPVEHFCLYCRLINPWWQEIWFFDHFLGIFSFTCFLTEFGCFLFLCIFVMD